MWTQAARDAAAATRQANAKGSAAHQGRVNNVGRATAANHPGLTALGLRTLNSTKQSSSGLGIYKNTYLNASSNAGGPSSMPGYY
jgi:hypothetical protein